MGADGGSEAAALLFFGLFAAYNLLPGEHDQRTIELLYTLPIRRRTLFFTKYAAAVGVLSVSLVVGQRVHGGDVRARFRLLRTPAGRTIPRRARAGPRHPDRVDGRRVRHARVVLPRPRLGAGRDCLDGRPACRAHPHPSLAIFDFASLMRVEHDGTTPILPWRAWLLHAGMSALALVVAAHLWLGRHEAFAAFYERLRARRRLWRVAMVLVLATAVLATVGLVAPAPKGGAGTGPSVGNGTDLQRLDTKHVHFTYHPMHEAQAQFLSREADQAYVRVRDWLRAPEIESVVADLTDESAEHLGHRRVEEASHRRAAAQAAGAAPPRVPSRAHARVCRRAGRGHPCEARRGVAVLPGGTGEPRRLRAGRRTGDARARSPDRRRGPGAVSASLRGSPRSRAARRALRRAPPVRLRRALGRVAGRELRPGGSRAPAQGAGQLGRSAETCSVVRCGATPCNREAATSIACWRTTSATWRAWGRRRASSRWPPAASSGRQATC